MTKIGGRPDSKGGRPVFGGAGPGGMSVTEMRRVMGGFNEQMAMPGEGDQGEQRGRKLSGVTRKKLDGEYRAAGRGGWRDERDPREGVDDDYSDDGGGYDERGAPEGGGDRTRVGSGGGGGSGGEQPYDDEQQRYDDEQYDRPDEQSRGYDEPSPTDARRKAQVMIRFHS